MNEHDTIYILNYINENTGNTLVNVYATYEKAAEKFTTLLYEKCPGKAASFYEAALSRQEFYNDDTDDWCAFYAGEVM